MTRPQAIIYDALSEPVLPESLRPEVVAIDKWQESDTRPILPRFFANRSHLNDIQIFDGLFGVEPAPDIPLTNLTLPREPKIHLVREHLNDYSFFIPTDKDIDEWVNTGAIPQPLKVRLVRDHLNDLAQFDDIFTPIVPAPDLNFTNIVLPIPPEVRLHREHLVDLSQFDGLTIIPVDRWWQPERRPAEVEEYYFRTFVNDIQIFDDLFVTVGTPTTGKFTQLTVVGSANILTPVGSANMLVAVGSKNEAEC